MKSEPSKLVETDLEDNFIVDVCESRAGGGEHMELGVQIAIAWTNWGSIGPNKPPCSGFRYGPVRGHSVPPSANFHFTPASLLY